MVTGNGFEKSNKVSIVDMSTNKATETNPMKTKRCRHAITKFGYLVYVIGGKEERSCEVFDIRTREWRYIADLNEERAEASAVASHRGMFYLFGG